MEAGDHDGASDWHQDIEFYNAARRAGKPCVMLVYEGENHSVAQKANQTDYHRRINAMVRSLSQRRPRRRLE